MSERIDAAGNEIEAIDLGDVDAAAAKINYTGRGTAPVRPAKLEWPRSFVNVRLMMVKFPLSVSRGVSGIARP